MTTIEIDPNVRVRGNETFSSMRFVDGAVEPSQVVDVIEPESGLTGQGRVTEVDHARGLVYIAVDWSTLVEPDDEEWDAEAFDAWMREALDASWLGTETYGASSYYVSSTTTLSAFGVCCATSPTRPARTWPSELGAGRRTKKVVS